ncbi:hypothetical protein CMUC_1922 [Campylobacter mucosalis CCUG 21559]|uniref:Uncharacterized protein n=1 Tax=Campylobacter mucosalis CCUG 21559 TaxID=1032067 RepID=A0A6G5QIX5_9BACT|nr:hypothetical protein CMUC_1922 [Campylobacter mucosalis CCUG 21559]
MMKVFFKMKDNEFNVWNVSSDKMIEYIRSVSPKDLKHLNENIKDTQDEWANLVWQMPTNPLGR